MAYKVGSPAGVPGAAVSDSAATVYAFDNMVGDGITDNLAVMQTAIAMADGLYDTAPGDLWIKEGNFYMSAELSVNKPIRIRGAGGGTVFPKTNFIFAAGVGHGFALESYNSGSDADDGDSRSDGAELDGLGIWYRIKGDRANHARWWQSTAKIAGDLIVPRNRVAYKHGQAFLCITGGTTGTTEPSWPATYPFTGPITGATNATPIKIAYGTSHNLSTGKQVTITGVGGNTAANGTWTITVTSSTEFTLDASVGNGAYTSGGTWRFADINDNGVIWRLFESHGIDMRSAFSKVRRCTVFGFPGNQINVNSNVFYTPARTANLIEIESCNLGKAGGSGLFMLGNDANACATYGVNSAVDCRGYAVWDDADLRNVHKGWHSRDNDSGHYRSTSGVGGATFEDCYEEAGAPSSVIVGYATVLRGTIADGLSGHYGAGTDPPSTWQALTAYALDSVHVPTVADGYVYKCIVAGTSGASEPTRKAFFRTGEDPTDSNFTDGSCTWRAHSVDTVSTGNVDLGTGIIDNHKRWNDLKDRAKVFFAPAVGQRAFEYGGDGSAFYGGGYVAVDKTWRHIFVPDWPGWAHVRESSETAYVLTAPNFPKHGEGYMFFPQGFLVGPDGASGGCRTFMGTAAPTTGTHGRGDECKNSAPSVGQPKSWLCTAAGTPGTWVSTGNL